MNIKPYDLTKLKSGDFFLIKYINEIRQKGSISKELMATGILLPKNKYSLDSFKDINIKKLISESEANAASNPKLLVEIAIDDEIENLIATKNATYRLKKKVPILL
jgi:hypothetical protein